MLIKLLPRSVFANIAFWNGQPSISPDIAYISNKADLLGTWDLHIKYWSTPNFVHKNRVRKAVY